MRKLFGFFRSQRGFTLIELLVVVAILGILTAVAVPSLYGMMNSGNVAAARAELATVQTAVDAYTAEHGIVPPDLATVVSQSPTYFRGTLKGTYSVALNGTVTQTGY